MCPNCQPCSSGHRLARSLVTPPEKSSNQPRRLQARSSATTAHQTRACNAMRGRRRGAPLQLRLQHLPDRSPRTRNAVPSLRPPPNTMVQGRSCPQSASRTRFTKPQPAGDLYGADSSRPLSLSSLTCACQPITSTGCRISPPRPGEGREAGLARAAVSFLRPCKEENVDFGKCRSTVEVPWLEKVSSHSVGNRGLFSAFGV